MKVPFQIHFCYKIIFKSACSLINMGKFPIACRIIRKLVKQSNFAQKDSKIKTWWKNVWIWNGSNFFSDFDKIAINLVVYALTKKWCHLQSQYNDNLHTRFPRVYCCRFFCTGQSGCQFVNSCLLGSHFLC